ncbi:branched-chain amino acid transport system permease protein [Actinomadura luteofluorescens]|uniref:Branched-chain amino acid transport system permease protein n=1 Tax=Actinomadura luteofluorescens TaxID=46163 RepID=A0A7Y9EI75_9ACTN|nr:branched-chain amino acid ABC transporter permease [Actinomadura luteofluorescens]NYD47630.1 branched-chain amino acid transport system permease protein [Actinomadura luteofluorescens]
MGTQLTLLTSAVEFALAGALLALSTYVTLWAGLLSFATVSFAAVGAFTATHLMSSAGLGLWPSLAAGGIGGGVLAGAAGVLLIRLADHWMALATVALILVTRVIVVNLGDLTGGSAGEVVPAEVHLWELVLVVAVACLLLARLARSRFGTAAVATREDPTAAATMGVRVRRVQVAAFVISGVLGGVAGVLQAGLLRYIDPDTFYIDLAVTVIACVVLGGAYHWFGSVIGAVVFTGLPVYVNQFVGQGQSIINGALLLVIMIWVPGGLVDPLRWRRLRERRAPAAPAAGAAAGPVEVRS